ncbi:MAG: A/G-specific adenine glycosylase [Peptococcaceae bacterium]|nr:A/G-specific adenine glycosylase [Peptococcaceae bacterium]
MGIGETMEAPKDICNLLLAWYAENKRDLPWRKNPDPYSTWISEMMLQQTRVETVIPYYYRFLERFPTVSVLANADEEEVLTAWKGLGYYSRARNLHLAAKIVQEKYQCVFPNSYQALRLLPGIGDYSAGAILSIAFNQPFPAVDGNVLRVISRVICLEGDISEAAVKKKIRQIVSDLIPEGRAGEFTQALMELGAILCLPQNPLCADCPIRVYCLADKNGRQDCIPVRRQSRPPANLDYWVAVVRKDNDILMQYREHTGLLGRMWGLPMAVKNPVVKPEKEFADQLGLNLQKVKSLGNTKHVFTHQVWNMEAIELMPEESRNDLPQGFAWIPLGKIDQIPIPKAFQKIFELGNYM